MNVISINKLSKSYLKDNRRIQVINNVSLNFENNKIYAIKGNSGAGKTTFLLCISLLCEVDSGSITINNKDISNLDDNELSKIRNNELGIIFQNYHLLPYLTATENIMVPLLIDTDEKVSELKKKCESSLEYVDLKDRSDHYPSELSGGEQQRIAIARALIKNPNIILADEPTGNLDKKNRIKVLKLFRKIANDGKCVIIVSHDDETLKYADEIYELKEGNLIKNEK